MFNPIFIPTLQIKQQDVYINAKILQITQEQEHQYYAKLMSLFFINASPFRKFLFAKGKKKTTKRYKKQTQKRYKKRTQKRYKKRTQKY